MAEEEKKVEETQESEKAPEKPVEEVGVDETPADDTKDMSDEQRKAFQRQRQEIKALKEKLEEKGEADKSPALEDVPSLAAEESVTGEDATAKALKAAQEAKIQAQLGKVYQKFPTLDPEDDGYDKTFERLVAANYLLEQRQGGNRSLVQVAQEVSSIMEKKEKEIAKEEKKKVETEISEREQASLEAAGTSRESEAVTAEHKEELRRATRQGGERGTIATMERIRLLEEKAKKK